MKEYEFIADCKMEGQGNKMVVDIPPQIRNLIWLMLKKNTEKTKTNKMKINIGIPYKKRTTGEYSQNHKINGSILQIAQSTGNSFEAVKWHIKKTAIDRGYPYWKGIDGELIPKSESEISTVEAAILIDTIEQFAAEWNIILKE